MGKVSLYVVNKLEMQVEETVFVAHKSYYNPQWQAEEVLIPPPSPSTIYPFLVCDAGYFHTVKALKKLTLLLTAGPPSYCTDSSWAGQDICTTPPTQSLVTA